MIPILYESTETKFQTNGICRLSDTISCIVHERRNDVFELELIYPRAGTYAWELKLGRIIYTSHDNSRKPQPFDITSITSTSDGDIRVQAYHISQRLKGILTKFNKWWFSEFNVVQDFFDSLNDKSEKGYIIGDCPFKFHTDITKTDGVSYNAHDSVCFKSVYDHLLDPNRGLLSIENGTGDIGEYKFDKFDVYLNSSRGKDEGCRIRTGTNVTTLTVDTTDKDICTGVLPFWTGKNGYGGGQDLVTVDADTIHLTDSTNQGSTSDIMTSDTTLPYQKIVPLDLSAKFSKSPELTDLRKEAELYLKQLKEKQKSDSTTYSVDLSYDSNNTSDLQFVDLCDFVVVEDVNLGVRKKLKVVEVWYDSLREQYTRMEIGILPKTFKQLVHKESQHVEVKTDNLQVQVNDVVKKTTVKQKNYPIGYDPSHPEKWKNTGQKLVDEYGKEMEEIATVNRHPVFVYKQKSGGGGGTSDGKVWFILRDRINLDYETTLKVYQYSNGGFTKKSGKVLSLEIIPAYFYVLNPKENEQYGHNVSARIIIELDVGTVMCNCMLTVKLRKCTNPDLNLWTYTSTIREIAGMGEDKTRNNPLFVYERKQSSEGIPFDGLIILEGHTQEWSGISQ